MLGKNLQKFIDEHNYNISVINRGTYGCRQGGYIISNSEHKLYELHRFNNMWSWDVIDISYSKTYIQVGNIISVIKVILKSQTFLLGLKSY